VQIVGRRRIVEGQPATGEARIGLNVRTDHVPFRQVIRKRWNGALLAAGECR
jgi:hypothetical protein